MGMQKIAVLGAGSWGTALAIHIAQRFETRLWGHNTEHMAECRARKQNIRYLPGHDFPARLTVATSLETALMDVDALVVAVPSTALKSLLLRIKATIKRNVPIINATKGLEYETNSFFSQLIDAVFEAPIQAVLSGPSFAKEVANLLPTAVTIAASNEQHAEFFVPFFHHGSMRIYKNLDPIGVQLAGSYKNIIAIATGISDGLKFGSNARAAIITRGLSEMSRLGLKLGGQLETFLGLAGVGDLVLTATDSQSRNYRFGYYLGEGLTKAGALDKVGQVVEGANSVTNMCQLGQSVSVELPIITEVYNILHHGRAPKASLENLLSRSTKNESLP